MVGVALLVALALARGADPAVLRAIGTGAAAIAGALALLTVAAILVDLSPVSEDSVEAGPAVAAAVADLAALIVLLTAGWLGATTARNAP